MMQNNLREKDVDEKNERQKAEMKFTGLESSWESGFLSTTVDCASSASFSLFFCFSFSFFSLSGGGCLFLLVPTWLAPDEEAPPPAVVQPPVANT